jgi:predicted kinase
VVTGAAIDWDAVEAQLAPVVDVEAMAATPQDASWHAEGDVWTHTRMALESLVADPAYVALDANARAVVFAAVLFHDVGKPGCTRHEPDGRISSRGHSGAGDVMVRAALWRAGVSFARREQICALVRSHQVPFFGVDKAPPDATRLAARLSLVTRNDWLATVAAADAHGRRTTDPRDRERILTNCALWRDLTAEAECLDRPRAFTDAHSRFVYLDDQSGTRAPEVPAFDDTVAEAVVLSGLPASGKSTWLAARPELAVISLDDLRDELGVEHGEAQGAVIAAARDRAKEHLRAGRTFAWNATSITRQMRRTLVDLCTSYRFRVRIVYCEASAAEQRARNRARPDAERVPERAMDAMLTRWTVPTPDEAHAVDYVVAEGADDGDGAPVWPPATP